MQLIIGFILLLVALYYLTIVADFFGANIYSKKELHFGKAFIPFFYWFGGKKKTTQKKKTSQKKSNK